MYSNTKESPLKSRNLKKYEEFVRENPKYKTALRELAYLPFEKYNVFKSWRPKPEVKVLFIAESPSWAKHHPYFYNLQSPPGRSGFGRNIFHLLDITGNTKEKQLVEFRERGYLLIDTIKCVYRKDLQPRIGKKIIRFSAKHFLERELMDFSPKIIFPLGQTALFGMKYLPKYQDVLSRYKKITKCPPSISVGTTKIIFCPFPGNRIGNYRKRIEAAFEEI